MRRDAVCGVCAHVHRSRCIRARRRHIRSEMMLRVMCHNATVGAHDRGSTRNRAVANGTVVVQADVLSCVHGRADSRAAVNGGVAVGLWAQKDDTPDL